MTTTAPSPTTPKTDEKRPKYKIVKRFYMSGEKYFVYKRYWRFFWSKVEMCWTLREAEQLIIRKKEVDEVRKKKPETVGYY